MISGVVLALSNILGLLIALRPEIIIAMAALTVRVLGVPLAVFGALLTIAYMLRLFNKVFLGATVSHKDNEGTPGMVMIVVVFAVLSILVGFAAAPLLDIVRVLVTQMFG